MKLIDRLYEYFELKGVKPTALEKKIGLGNGYLGKQHKRGGDFGSEIIEKIVYEFPDLNIDWLLTGRGTMVHNPTHNPSHNVGKYQNEPIQESGNYLMQEPAQEYSLSRTKNTVYFVQETARAGFLAGFSQEQITHLPRTSLPWLPSGTYYNLKVEGDSMYSTLSNGDYVLCKEIEGAKSLKNGYIYVISTFDDGVIVKRCYKLKGIVDKIKIVSDNPIYGEDELEIKRIRGIYEVIELNSQNLGPKNDKERLYKALLEINGIQV